MLLLSVVALALAACEAAAAPGSSTARMTKYFGAYADEALTTFLGFGFTQDAASALSVTGTVGSESDLITTNDVDGYTYVGVVNGAATYDPTASFLAVTGTQPTEAGAEPASGSGKGYSRWQDVSGQTGVWYESAVWTVSSNGALSATWINPGGAGVTSPAVVHISPAIATFTSMTGEGNQIVRDFPEAEGVSSYYRIVPETEALEGYFAVFSDAAKTEFLGYADVSSTASASGGFSLTQDASDALIVKATVSAASNLVPVNEKDGYSYIGVVNGAESYTGGYVVVTGTRSTYAGAVASTGSGSGYSRYDDVKGATTWYESAVWTVTSDGSLSVNWVNPGSTSVALVGVMNSDTNYLRFSSSTYGYTQVYCGIVTEVA
ncbi:hypothetical protein MNV49_004635 [Pseudohyphozyma bogoriensis]|nr:hypothetical protein MNV49_004635 [Pseudohyphozyma bogoriensis]